MARRPHVPARPSPAALLALLLIALAPLDARAARPFVFHTPASAHLRATPGVVLVIADPAAVAGDGRVAPLRVVPAAAAAAMARLGLDHVDAVGVSPSAGAPRVLRLTSSRGDLDPVAAAAELRATGAFRAVSPNYRLTPYVLPNDPQIGQQWYVSDGGVADIRLPGAWDITHGDTSVVIAIMDTGVDTGHPDLASKIWRNRAEIPGNGIDDDGDGYVDDVVGWDFGTNDNDPNPEYTADPSGIDVGFHGTFCAGIAAAATNNADGIAGAGWDCRIMALKVSHPDSGITSEAVAAGFLYAAAKHVSVLSMSFGGPGDPGVPEFFQSLVDLATDAGVVCVAAAGNDSTSTPSYPAACTHVLSVGATDDTNARAWFSDYGPWVLAAAPGSTMWSTICRNYVFTDLDQIIYLYFFGWDGETPYMEGDGTSFSCPLAAGVCGMVRARFPSLTPLQVIAQVVNTGDAVAYDHPIGPRINATRAVTSLLLGVDRAPVAPARLAFGGPWPAPARRGAAWTLALALPHDDVVTLELFDVDGRRVDVRTAEEMAAGTTTLRWAPRAPAAGVYFVRMRTRGGESATAKVAVLD